MEIQKKNRELLKKNHVYDEKMEHDACGVGLVASTEGLKSRKVVRVRDYWELIKVMEAKTFSGKDHNKRAIEYFEKKVELDKGRVKMIYHTEYEHNGQRVIGK